MANQLEKRACACIAKRAAIESEIQKASQRKQGQRFSTAWAQARAQEAPSIRLADDVQTLFAWFHHDVLAPNGLDTDSRTEFYQFVTDALARLERFNGHRIRLLHRRLERERGPLLGFAIRLDQGLKAIADQHRIPLAAVRELFVLHRLLPTTQNKPIGRRQPEFIGNSGDNSTPPNERCASSPPTSIEPVPRSKTSMAGCAATSFCAVSSGPVTSIYYAFTSTTTPSSAANGQSGWGKHRPIY